jgi:hypothetical protein
MRRREKTRGSKNTYLSSASSNLYACEAQDIVFDLFSRILLYIGNELCETDVIFFQFCGS